MFLSKAIWSLPLALVVSAWTGAQSMDSYAKSGEFKSPTPDGPFRQDPALDNLSHPPGYVTAPWGTFAEVAERGEGETTVILIAGLGPSWHIFDSFISANKDEYRFLAVTLAGYGGSSAPPMPPTGTMFSEGAWLSASRRALQTLIEQRALSRPLIVAFYSDAARIALRFALAQPDRVGGVLVLSASARFPLPPGADPAPGLDGYAQNWFKTVTEITWSNGMWPPDSYAADRALSEKTWWDALIPSIPTAVRYQIETWADDLVPDLVGLTTPTLVLSPGFADGFLDTPMGTMIGQRFHGGWEDAIAAGAPLEHTVIPGARLLLWDDRPTEVQSALRRLVELSQASESGDSR